MKRNLFAGLFRAVVVDCREKGDRFNYRFAARTTGHKLALEHLNFGFRVDVFQVTCVYNLRSVSR